MADRIFQNCMIPLMKSIRDQLENNRCGSIPYESRVYYPEYSKEVNKQFDISNLYIRVEEDDLKRVFHPHLLVLRFQ